MTHVYMFQWNIPKDNHSYGQTDSYLNIIARWNTEQFYNDGTPMVFIDLINPNLYTCMMIKDWSIVEQPIKEIAREHFKDFARQEKINKARAVLISAGEIICNPILERYEQNVISEIPY